MERQPSCKNAPYGCRQLANPGKGHCQSCIAAFQAQNTKAARQRKEDERASRGGSMVEARPLDYEDRESSPRRQQDGGQGSYRQRPILRRAFGDDYDSGDETQTAESAAAKGKGKEKEKENVVTPADPPFTMELKRAIQSTWQHEGGASLLEVMLKLQLTWQADVMAALTDGTKPPDRAILARLLQEWIKDATAKYKR